MSRSIQRKNWNSRRSGRKLCGDGHPEAQNEVTNDRLKAVVKGSGNTVVKQVPARGTSLSQQGKVILYTEEDAAETTVTVPKLVGLSPSAANTVLTNLHLNIKLNGGAANATGAKVVSQSVGEGEKVPIGTVIEVECRTTASDG